MTSLTYVNIQTVSLLVWLDPSGFIVWLKLQGSSRNKNLEVAKRLKRLKKKDSICYRNSSS